MIDVIQFNLTAFMLVYLRNGQMKDMRDMNIQSESEV